MAPLASAGCNPQATPLIPSAVGTSQPMDPFLDEGEKVLRVFAEAQSETSGPFLSLDAESSAAARHQAVAAPAGAQSTIGRVAGDAPPSAEYALDRPFAANHYLNLRRPVVGVLYLSSSAMAASSRDSFHVRMELFLDDLRLGGDEVTFDAATASGPWTPFFFCFRAELPVLAEGETLRLRLSLLSGTGDLVVGTGAEQQTQIEFHTYAVDPLSNALYLEDGHLVGAAPPSSGAPYAYDFPAEGGLLLPVIGLRAFPSVRRRSAPFVVAGLLLALVLSGCLGGAGEEPRDVDASGDPRATVESEILEDQDLAAAEHGALQGILQDEVGIPIGGGHVALLGTNLFDITDSHGRFGLDNVSAGSYKVRADAEGFLSIEDTVNVEKGRRTILNITLVRPHVGPANLKAHSHDEWGEETRLLIADADVNYRALKDGGYACYGPGLLLYAAPCDTPIPLPAGARVLPGATRVEIVFDWRPQAGLDELGLRVLTAANQTPTQTFVPRGAGDPFRVAFFPHEADPGHQKYTSWQLFLRPAWPRSHFHPVGPAADPSLTVNVKVFIEKGVVPLEPAHRTFWNGASQLPVIPEEARTMPCIACDYPRSASDTWWFPPDGVLVPPGTAELQGYLRWINPQGAPTGTEWSVVYKPATVPPGTPPTVAGAWKPAQMGGSAPNRTFTIAVEGGESDQFYQHVSNWIFTIDDGVPGTPAIAYSPNTAYQSQFFLSVRAIRDPSYVEETPDA